MYPYYDFYSKTIDIEISPERDIIYHFDKKVEKKDIRISFCDILGLKLFFDTEYGVVLSNKVLSNKTTLYLFITDSWEPNNAELNYLKNNLSFFERKNVHFYQSWYSDKFNFNFYLGSTIHTGIKQFIEFFKYESFSLYEKEKHFLSLNNLHSPNRENLFNYYNSLNGVNQNSFLCSFMFKNISLVKNFNNNYETMYGTDLINYYKKSLIELVVESSNVSITEKSYKPLIAGIPFIYWMPDWDYIKKQIMFFEQLDIDVNYFGIDYSNHLNVKRKVNELLSIKIEDVIVKYKDDFKKAEKNKIKIFNFIDKIEKELLRV